MKKLLCFLAFASLMASSCSSSDDINTSTHKLLKKTISSYSNGNVITSTATYNGRKLDNYLNDNGYGVNLTYTGNLITQMDYQLNGATYITKKFTYNSDNNIASYTELELENNSGEKEVFQYNSDGSVSVQVFSGDLNSQTSVSGAGTITFQNGEVYQMTDVFTTKTYTYDGKKNPYNDITGFGKVTFIDDQALGISQNVTKVTSTTDPDIVKTYAYDADGYPTNAVQTYSGGTVSTQYVYE